MTTGPPLTPAECVLIDRLCERAEDAEHDLRRALGRTPGTMLAELAVIRDKLRPFTKRAVAP